MTVYIKMWDEIKKMDLARTEYWLERVGNPTGRQISFRGLGVLDVDLIPALRFWRKDLLIQEGKETA